VTIQMTKEERQSLLTALRTPVAPLFGDAEALRTALEFARDILRLISGLPRETQRATHSDPVPSHLPGSPLEVSGLSPALPLSPQIEQRSGHRGPRSDQDFACGEPTTAAAQKGETKSEPQSLREQLERVRKELDERVYQHQGQIAALEAAREGVNARLDRLERQLGLNQKGATK
jgi:hypothetical protein